MSACELYDTDITITAKLPDLPEHWKYMDLNISFRINFPGKDGLISEILINPGVKTISLKVPKYSNIPITAIPEIRNQSFLPAGGIFPLDLDKNNFLKLKWTSGPTAYILLKIISAGINPDFINIEKLHYKIIEELPNDIWDLDINKIITKLIENYFRITYIKYLEKKEINIKLKAGEWFTESPFSLLIPGNLNTDTIIDLSFGFHTLSCPDYNYIYRIFIDAKDTIIIEETL